MFPLLSIIIAVTVGLTYGTVVKTPHRPDLVSTAIVIVFTALLGKVMGNLLVKRALESRESAGSLALRTSAHQRIMVLAAYFVVVYQFHWPAVVRELGIGGWVLIDDLVVLLPFLVMVVASMVAAWSAETRLDLHDFTAWSYLKFQLRQYLLPVIPVFSFLLLYDLLDLGYRSGIQWLAELTILVVSYPFLQWLMVFVLLLALYCLIPFLLRWMWGMSPLPEGPLRDRLTAFSQREGFKAREILVWPTGRNIMNAAVIGLAGRFRYVILTDALIETLEEDEVEAVFAHEVGHAKHNHMLLFLFFILGYTLLAHLTSTAIARAAPAVFGRGDIADVLFAIGSILLWFGIVFGFVSRRFEQQADVYGAMATGREHREPDGHPFVRALEGLALQMGDLREVKGWRHFSLGVRIEYLKGFLADPAVRKRYRRGMATLLGFYFGLLLAIGVAAATTVPTQVREGRVRASRQRMDWLREHGRGEEALDEARRLEDYARAAGIELKVEIPGGQRTMSPRETAMRILDASRTEGIGPPERVYWLTQLARAYLALDETGAARDAVQDAMMIAGDHPLLLPLMGAILEREGRWKGARLAFETALALAPPDSPYAAEMRSLIEKLP